MSLQGERLGPYCLQRLLGSGGMGEVYLAEDARIGQQVAIKVMRSEGMSFPESSTVEEATRLFEREAKAIARLDHPNILPLYAYGEELLHEQLLSYLVMPYRKEGTLASWLRQRGSASPLSPVQVAPLLHQAAQALQHAHQQQVIHQDVKPTNFLVRLRDDQPERPDLLLADFGIAKLTSAMASTSQSVRGTPIYMAPEQWEGRPVPASDQYALAIMAYELLVGHPPFQGGPVQLMCQHNLTPPPAPSTLNPCLSPAIDAVLLRALAKHPEERYPSVLAFAQAFQEAAQHPGVLRATLAISQTEAVVGTMRRLKLPDGRQVSVSVPAGVREGSILRLEGHGWPDEQGGPAGPLVLTIRIVSVEQAPVLSQEGIIPTFPVSMPPEPFLAAPEVERPARASDVLAAQKLTNPASNESAVAPHGPPSQQFTPPRVVTAPANPIVLPPGKPPSSALAVPHPSPLGTAQPGKRRIIQRIALVGLVIVSLVGGIVWFTVHQYVSPTVRVNPSPTAHMDLSPTVRATSSPTVRVSPSPTAHAGLPIITSITEFPVPTTASYPADITAGPDGNLWFDEFDGNKIGRMTPSGTITEFLPPAPTSLSGEIGPITAGPDGNIWFTDTANNGKIGRMTPSGTITEFPLPGPNIGIGGITAGPDGNLWFTEENVSKIGRMTPSGTITEFSLPNGYVNGPAGITVGPDGNLWFTESDTIDKIGRITRSGTVTEFFTSDPDPGDLDNITAGPDGNIWFTESAQNKIGRMTPNGTITEFPLPTPVQQHTGPWAITRGPDGNLWFTEPTKNKIGRMTPNGTVTEFPLPNSISSPLGITVGPDGNLWFTEGTGNKIGRITLRPNARGGS